MSQIILVRQDTVPLTEQERRTLASLVLKVMDGHSESDKRAWRALWGVWRQMEPGEATALNIHVERMSPTHRRHFAMEQRWFQAQEQFATLNAFRTWVKVGAAFVDWTGQNGELVAVPKSMNWVDLDELEMREVHAEMVAFLRSPRAALTLWPALSDRGRIEMVDELMKGWGE